MTPDDRANLVLASARVLYVNGQATEQMVSAAERLGRAVGLRATIMPRWGELHLVANDKGGTVLAELAADPAGVEMDRVASTMRAVDDVASGRLAPDATMKTVGDEVWSIAPPSRKLKLVRLAQLHVTKSHTQSSESSPQSAAGTPRY